MPETPITLDQFYEQMNMDIHSFMKRWKENHQADPESWPMEMNEGDWFDQFISDMTGGAF